MAFKYRNFKFYLCLQGNGTSKVVIGCRCTIGGQPLKDLNKVIHHRIPLFLEGLLEKYFDRISYSLIFILSPMGDCRGLWGWSCKGLTKSSPKSLYPDLIGDMQRRIEKEKTALIPLIRILWRNTIEYKYNHKHIDAMEIVLHFIHKIMTEISLQIWWK